jgi:hypothetical protein
MDRGRHGGGGSGRTRGRLRRAASIGYARPRGTCCFQQLRQVGKCFLTWGGYVAGGFLIVRLGFEADAGATLVVIGQERNASVGKCLADCLKRGGPKAPSVLQSLRDAAV